MSKCGCSSKGPASKYSGGSTAGYGSQATSKYMPPAAQQNPMRRYAPYSEPRGGYFDLSNSQIMAKYRSEKFEIQMKQDRTEKPAPKRVSNLMLNPPYTRTEEDERKKYRRQHSH